LPRAYYFTEGGKVTEGVQNLVQQIQEQILKSAQDFYENSLGDLMGQVHNDRSQLQELLEQLPESQEDAREQLEQLVSSYEVIENSLEEVAQQHGVEDVVNQASQQAQETAGEVAEQAQDVAGQATEQAQETAEQASEEAQDAVEGTAEQFQEAAGETTEQVQGLGGSESESGAVEEEEPDATHAAKQKAEQLGVDLSEVEGSGAGGRITVADVVKAAQG
jgi:pyruvate/2-oxoglutarate dehydrogenase complex dihydrolipoamide acyltransferase (E2) component